MAVTLVEKYNPEWPRWLEEIKVFLGADIVKACIRIEHVGSTSIPGMTAKPVIDIDMVIAPGDWGKVKSLLEERGYSHRGDLGVPDRESFKLIDENEEKSLPRHHLYVCPEQSIELRRHIAFREYLKTHQADRERLSKLKWELAERFDNDKYPYMDGKDAMVKKIIQKAMKWHKKKKCKP